MRKLKNILMLVILAIAVLCVGTHKPIASHAPSIERAIDMSFTELKKDVLVEIPNDTPLIAETDTFSLESTEVSGANIESVEAFSELYIEEYE